MKTSISSSIEADQIASSSAPRTMPLPHKLVVGATAGIFGTSLIYPIDILKTTIQTSSGSIKSLDGLRSTVAALSKGGFYRGFSACLIGIAPEKAIKLTVNDVIRDIYTDNGKKSIRVHEEIIAGSLAGLLQLVVTVPYESVKIKMQMSTQIEGQSSALQVVKNMISQGGLYRGFVATLCRDVPFCFIFFPLYSQLKVYQLSRYSPTELMISEPSHVGLVAGIGAGAISAAIVTPADMLKTRIQQGLNGNSGFFKYAKEVASKEGYLSLFKGWQTRVAVIAPLYGIVSLAFELQKKWFSY